MTPSARFCQENSGVREPRGIQTRFQGFVRGDVGIYIAAQMQPIQSPQGLRPHCFRTLVPEAIFFGMVFGTRVLKYWVLGPSTIIREPSLPSCRWGPVRLREASSDTGDPEDASGSFPELPKLLNEGICLRVYSLIQDCWKLWVTARPLPLQYCPVSPPPSFGHLP